MAHGDRRARDHGFERDLVLLATDHAHDSEAALWPRRTVRAAHRMFQLVGRAA
jgi:hypothetical protein